jgi:hypothetical protein
MTDSSLMVFCLTSGGGGTRFLVGLGLTECRQAAGRGPHFMSLRLHDVDAVLHLRWEASVGDAPAVCCWRTR